MKKGCCMPQIGFNNFRIAAHDVGRTAGDKRTVLKYKELLAHLHDEAHIVLDEQHRHPALADGVDKLDEHRRLGVVHAPGRLVENDELGIGGQRTGDFE